MSETIPPPPPSPQLQRELSPSLTVRNLQLVRERGSAVVSLRFDVHIAGELWRFAGQGGEPGTWNAAWLFVKLRQSVHKTGLRHAEVLRELAHSSHAKAQPELEERARQRLEKAFARGAKSATVTRESHVHVLDGHSPGLTEVSLERVNVTETRSGVYDVHQLGSWDHCRLAPSNDQPWSSPDYVLTVSADGVGAFLHRSASNTGCTYEAVIDAVELKLAVGDLQFPIEVQVHALEMVSVAEHAFSLGDPRGSEGPADCFHDPRKSGDDKTYKIDSEDGIEVPEQLTWGDGPLENCRIPAAFPKGYRSYYVMRSPVSQAEYAAFINSLPGKARTARFPFGGQGQYRFSIFMAPGGRRYVTRPNRACNWLSWADGMAYLWWAGLRPLTEFEWEKACRGPLPAVTGEYAWGTTNLVQSRVILGDEGSAEMVTGNSNIANSDALFHGGDGDQGPVRDRAFSSTGIGGPVMFEQTAPGPEVSRERPNLREVTGASYYGVCGLSGNLWDFVITAAVEAGRSFAGVHGDGHLTEFGEPVWQQPAPWPGLEGNGIGFKGGSWFTVASEAEVADRKYAAGLRGYIFRSHDSGIRGARTAP